MILGGVQRCFVRSSLAFVWMLGLPVLAQSPLKNVPQVRVKGQTFQVEVARTSREWQKGLMFRERLGPREGMWFWGSEERPQTFWMKNTLIPLDIIYLSKDFKVVSFIEKAEPLSEKHLPSEKPAMHVLELPGGSIKNLGLKVGDKVEPQGF